MDSGVPSGEEALGKGRTLVRVQRGPSSSGVVLARGPRPVCGRWGVSLCAPPPPPGRVLVPGCQMCVPSTFCRHQHGRPLAPGPIGAQKPGILYPTPQRVGCCVRQPSQTRLPPAAGTTLPTVVHGAVSTASTRTRVSWSLEARCSRNPRPWSPQPYAPAQPGP